MGRLGIPELLIILAIIILIFGANRLPEIGRGIGKGIKNFKKGMAEEDEPKPATRIEGKAAPEPQFDRETERAREEQR